MTPRWILIAALALGSVPAHGETIKITIDKLVFAPVEVTAKVGDTIEWVNNDILAHTATATQKDWDVPIAPKKAGKVLLTKEGAVEYFCRYHPNMKGRIVVTP
jgi:plastocyanin